MRRFVSTESWIARSFTSTVLVTVSVAVYIALFLPGFALAVGAGDDQYFDPLAELANSPFSRDQGSGSGESEGLEGELSSLAKKSEPKLTSKPPVALAQSGSSEDSSSSTVDVPAIADKVVGKQSSTGSSTGSTTAGSDLKELPATGFNTLAVVLIGLALAVVGLLLLGGGRRVTDLIGRGRK